MGIKLIIFKNKDYYRLSKTTLSSIVHDSGSVGNWMNPNEKHHKWERFDYGFMSLCIEAGLTVSIRKPTDKEIEIYDSKLITIQNEHVEPVVDNTFGNFPILEVTDRSGVGCLVKKLVLDI